MFKIFTLLFCVIPTQTNKHENTKTFVIATIFGQRGALFDINAEVP